MHKFVVVAVGVSSIGLLVGLTFLLIMWPVAAPLHPANQTATTTPITTAMNSINGTEPNVDAVIAKWFAPLSPLTLGGVALAASIADTTSERQQGLSYTPYLPTGVVKLFVFEEAGPWGFWMKNMNIFVSHPSLHLMDMALSLVIQQLAHFRSVHLVEHFNGHRAETLSIFISFR